MLNPLFALLFPENCLHCEQALLPSEKWLCSLCNHEINWLTKLPKNNTLEEMFYGKVCIEEAYSLFVFVKGGASQTLIHELKYKGKAEIGEFYGRLLGEMLKENCDANDIEAIVPVPLTFRKKRKRGYNQSEKIAKGIASIIKKPVLKNKLHRIKSNQSQTQHNKFTRWQNIQESFDYKEEKKYNHLLLVDDVITTGATLESCARAIKEKTGAKISLAALAFAPPFA